MNRKIRMLVITHAPWRNDTSVGNSYSNIFASMDDRIEFAQLYIRDGMPENNLVHIYYHISEKQLFKSIINRRPVGNKFTLENPMETPPVEFSNVYNRMRRLRWNIFLLGRDVASSLGKWKTKELDNFLDDFKPDIIFGTLGFIPIINQLMVYARKKTGAVLIPYPWDDWYHINRNYLSPFYYLRIWIERHYIKKTVNNSAYLYTITEQMRDEYTQIFRKPCKVLRKGFEFDVRTPQKATGNEELRLLYAGNIGDKRWEILARIVDAIKHANSRHKKQAHLVIYTLSPVSEEMKMALNVEGCSSLMGAIPSKEVPQVMSGADILVHVEPIDKTKLENNRLSFSTKIVDYLFQGKCILAVGGENASMRYLKENDAAIVVNDLSQLDSIIHELLMNQDVINRYAERAWNCGVKNHDIKKIQDMIYTDFINVMNSTEKSGIPE